MTVLTMAPTPTVTRPPYVVTRVDHTRFTERLNTHRIVGPLTIVPEPYQSKGFRASSLSTCLRATGYRLLNIKPTSDTYNPDNQLSADQGTALHVRIQEQLVGAGMVYQHGGKPAIELSLKNIAVGDDLAQLVRWDFSGHLDAVLEDNNGTLSIFDLKTGKPEMFDPGYAYLDEKLQSYATQTTSYMAHFSAPDGRRAHVTYVYMLSRGETKTRALYRVAWQPERWAVDAARLDVASAAVAAGELPPPEIGKDCRWCGWRVQCEAERGDAPR